jgi:hypothetical protein
MVVARCFRGAWWNGGLANTLFQQPWLRGVPCAAISLPSFACHESSLDGSRVIPRLSPSFRVLPC